MGFKMLTDFMITRTKRRSSLILSVFGLAVAAAACESVPLLAPTGSTISITASNTAIPANGSVVLTAQVVEPAGTPPHSGTHVIFTTSLGNVVPSEVETDVN